MKKILLLAIIFLLLGASIVLAQAAPDPIRIATGARTLGMGKAFVGLADDVSSVFLNPAGLAAPDRWQITSMSGKLLEEYNYVSLSGLYPTKFGNFGLAYIRSDISGALPTTIEVGSNHDDPIYTVDLTQEQMSYYNNLIMLSYANKLAPLFQLPALNTVSARFPGLKDIQVGANVKLFAVNLTGDHIERGSASGTELDLGIQGKPLSWLALGANIQNALPMSMGGKLVYQSGWEESYPAILKAGAAFDLLGPENALYKFGTHKLTLLTDFDYEISRSSKIPTLLHLGAEWKPINLIAIRAGIDQEMAGTNNIENNFSSGVGIYYGDFRFDYAYHQFAGAPGIDNHFFSLSYGIAPARQVEDPLISSPDKLITTETVVAIKGKAVDTEIMSIKVNGLKVTMSPRGDFETNVSLHVGKNTILVEGLDYNGKPIASDTLRILRLITYPDVHKTHWANEQIDYIGTLGVIKGYPDGSFKPEGTISRAELSTLLMRITMNGDSNVPNASKKRFKDLPLTHWAAKYVNLAAATGIVKGYPNNTFKPSGNVTRAEGLTMITRFGGVSKESYSNLFIDVKKNHWVAPILAGAYQEGMLIHFKDKPFFPNNKLIRSEAVELLYRSKPVITLIEDLRDFEKGY